MHKYRAIIETGDADIHNNSISKEVMDKMSRQAPGLPVTINFNPNNVIGKVTAARFGETGVEVDMEIDLENPDHVFAAPAYFAEVLERLDNNGTLLKKGKLTSIGLVLDPANQHLTPLEKIE